MKKIKAKKATVVPATKKATFDDIFIGRFQCTIRHGRPGHSKAFIFPSRTLTDGSIELLEEGRQEFMMPDIMSRAAADPESPEAKVLDAIADLVEARIAEAEAE